MLSLKKKSMIEVTLVDDHPLSFYGLKSISEKNGEKIFDVKNYFENGKDLIDNIESLQVDLILCDLHLTDMNGFDLLTFIKSTHPEFKVAMYTAFFEKESIMKAIQLGADGIISKGIHADELINCIKEIKKGKRFVTTSDTRIFLGNHQKYSQKNIVLSNRESEVLELIKKGSTNKEIAIILNISVSTVEFHRKNIYQKLDVKNVAELINKTQSLDKLTIS